MPTHCARHVAAAAPHGEQFGAAPVSSVQMGLPTHSWLAGSRDRVHRYEVSDPMQCSRHPRMYHEGVGLRYVAHNIRGCLRRNSHHLEPSACGVFELDRDAWRRHVPIPNSLLLSAEQKANMQRLLHMLGQTAAEQHQALAEYKRGLRWRACGPLSTIPPTGVHGHV